MHVDRRDFSSGNADAAAPTTVLALVSAVIAVGHKQ